MMEFLKARLREDETAARAVKPGKNQDVERLRARVLADVEAKRRLLVWVEENRFTPLKAEAEARGLPIWQRAIVDVIAGVPEHFRSPVIAVLVAAYADHPDFRPEWRLIEEEQELGEEYEPGDDKSRTRARGRTV
ncbi:hypothetical protein KBY91_15310 [Streptomyces sp. RK23]|nr:hypothetical protein [Streptomyces sp. RK74B]MBQ1004777.1 hypothetical protein [Streptomyces sp. RK23]